MELAWFFFIHIQVMTMCVKMILFPGAFMTEERGEVEMKGKGKRMCYWLVGQSTSRNPVQKKIPDRCHMPFWKILKNPKLTSSGVTVSDELILLKPKYGRSQVW